MLKKKKKLPIYITERKAEEDPTMSVSSEMNMLISGVFDKENRKQACVYFSAGEAFAEGYIPDCRIVSHKGFTDDELKQLEDYMEANLQSLKEQASQINPIKAMMKD